MEISAVLALTSKPELVVLADNEQFVHCAVGLPRYPALDCGQMTLAYIAITQGSGRWQTVVALADAQAGVLDVLPDAAVFAPAVWSPDGSRLLVVQGNDEEAAAVIWHRTTGHTEKVLERRGLRSATWASDGSILYSTDGSVHSVDGLRGPDEVLPAARSLQGYGSDDLFVTLDQLVTGPNGSVSAVERWSTQGQPPEEYIVAKGSGNWARVGRGRYPQWLNGALAYTSERGEPVTRRPRAKFPVGAGVHSIGWCAPSSNRPGGTN